MPNVEFENDYRPTARYTSPSSLGMNTSQHSGMAGWLVKKGIIKDESHAGTVLVSVVIFNIVATIFIIYYFLL